MVLGPAGDWRLEKGGCLEVALAGMLGAHVSTLLSVHSQGAQDGSCWVEA